VRDVGCTSSTPCESHMSATCGTAEQNRYRTRTRTHAHTHSMRTCMCYTERRGYTHRVAISSRSLTPTTFAAQTLACTHLRCNAHTHTCKCDSIHVFESLYLNTRIYAYAHTFRRVITHQRIRQVLHHCLRTLNDLQNSYVTSHSMILTPHTTVRHSSQSATSCYTHLPTQDPTPSVQCTSASSMGRISTIVRCWGGNSGSFAKGSSISVSNSSSGTHVSRFILARGRWIRGVQKGECPRDVSNGAFFYKLS
jgi:hypothetical protein